MSTETPTPRVLIAIPSYNCAKQLPRVLDEIDQRLIDRVAEIAVIDNGSTQNTVEVALAYKKKRPMDGKLKIFQNTDNYNLGGTHKVAFLRAEKLGFTHVVILHGDNQAKSDEANDLLDYCIERPKHQTVLGSRFTKGSRLIGYDKKRIIGNKVLNTIYSIATMRRLTDLGSGLNLFALADLDREAYLNFADKLTFNYELILDLVRRKIAFAYLPITWREEDQVSNARNTNIFMTALINLWRWRFMKHTSAQTKKTKDDYTCKEIR